MHQAMKDRFQCEVRHILALRSKDRQAAVQYLELVEKSRGKPEADRLKAAAAEQWALGSRGKWGDWRDDERTARSGVEACEAAA